MSKERKKRQQELLGMSVSTAEKKLRKAIILDLAKQLGKNVCLECGRAIDEPDDLAIKHVEDWEENPAQFFALTNIALGHVSCGAGDHAPGQGEERMRVEVIVENPDGQPLRGCRHQGQIYVAGKKDQRYQVRVRNTTGQRLLVVTTVDGRNVNTGKKGSWSDSGHVLEPYDEWVFTGWRQSDNKVAAFRLGSKGDSYSAQMGTAENVGVIGVAVFEEKTPEKPVITIREREYVPYPVPYPYPSWPRTRPWWFDTFITCDSMPSLDLQQDLQQVRTPYELGNTYRSANVEYSTRGGDAFGSSGTFLSSSLNVGSEPSRGHAQMHNQQLGTGWGETLTSQVKKTEFKRASAHPCEVHELRYDSLRALKKAGIMGRRPSQQQKTPSAFPQSQGGYCPPPRRRHVYK